MDAKTFGDPSMVLALDGGDCFAGNKVYDSIRAEYLFEGMGRLGYDAVALGELDLSLGQAYLQDLARRTGLDLVSANVVVAGGGERFVKPYVVRRIGGRRVLGLEVGGVRIGVTSVLRLEEGARLSPRFHGDRELIVKDPAASLREVVQEMRGKTDVIVCMAHTGMDAAKEIARAVGGVDVMLVGHGAYRNKDLVFVGKTPLIQPGDRAMMMAVLEAKLSDQRRVTGVSGRLYTLDEAYTDDEGMAELLTEFRAAIAAIPDTSRVVQ